MNRRHLLTISGMLALTAPAAKAGGNGSLPRDSFYRIIMVDPRLITKTRETQAIGYEKNRSDVMGSVNLSKAESLKLDALLKQALTSSDGVPFCGHSPAYVIMRMDGAKAGSYVSVCTLCGTWCGPEGELRVLKDAELMPFLTKVLPLPVAFSHVRSLADLMELDSKLDFLELPSKP